MIRRFFIILCFFALITCDDGDILSIELDFEGELELCEDFEDSYIVFDSRQDPDEALILIFPKNDTNAELFTTATEIDTPTELDINGTTRRFIFRSYNRAISSTDICAVVSPGNLVITEDDEASSGTVFVTVTIEDDDNDGVPNESEDVNGNGDLEDDDTDGDGLPNYKDDDDDGDNVYTLNEIDTANEDGDNDPSTGFLDTDGDGIADYLDTDDDNDDIPTYFEDEDGENGPLNDTAENEAGETVPHFRNTSETTSYTFDSYVLENTFTRSVSTRFIVEDINIGIINTTFIDFGTYENDFTVSSED